MVGEYSDYKTSLISVAGTLVPPPSVKLHISFFFSSISMKFSSFSFWLLTTSHYIYHYRLYLLVFSMSPLSSDDVGEGDDER